MLLDKRKHPAFSSPDWSYEIKYDGWRMLAEFGAGQAELRTRNGIDASLWFPEVCAALSDYKGGPHVIDGEAPETQSGWTYARVDHDRRRRGPKQRVRDHVL